MLNKRFYPDYEFAQDSIMSANQLNTILQLADEQRMTSGPYYIVKLSATGAEWQPTASSFYLELLDDPVYIGGVEYKSEVPTSFRFLPGTGETIRRYKVDYFNSANSRFWTWKDTQFFKVNVDGGYKWITKLNDKNIFGNRSISVSGETLNYTTLLVSSMTCRKDWDSLPIWNGHKNAISFRTNDSRVENYTGWKAVFDIYNWKYSIYASNTNLGLTNYMTEAHIKEMASGGYEIGNHTLTNWGNGDWEPNSLTQFEGAHNLNILFDLRADIMASSHLGAINYWNDRGPSGFNFGQATSSKRPLFYSGVTVNGMPGVFFTNTDDAISGGPFNYPTGTNFALFMAIDASGTSAADRILFEIKSATNLTQLRLAYTSASLSANSSIIITGSAEKDLGTSVPGRQILSLMTSPTGINLYRNGVWVSGFGAFGFAPSGTYTIGNTGGGATVGHTGFVFHAIGVMDVENAGGNYYFREDFEGYMAHRYGMSDVLHYTHKYKHFLPVKPMKPLQNLFTEIYGNKSELEELINFNNGGNNLHNNYKCLTYSYPTSSNLYVDEFVTAAVMMGHIGAVIASSNASASITGRRAHGHFSGQTWNWINPYMIGPYKGIDVLITGYTQPTGETFLNISSWLDQVAYTSSRQQYANSWINITWRNNINGGDNVSSGHLRAMLEAVRVHSGDFWVAPVGTVLDYWRKAHPNEIDERYNSFF